MIDYILLLHLIWIISKSEKKEWSMENSVREIEFLVYGDWIDEEGRGLMS